MELFETGDPIKSRRGGCYVADPLESRGGPFSSPAPDPVVDCG